MIGSLLPYIEAQTTVVNLKTFGIVTIAKRGVAGILETGLVAAQYILDKIIGKG